MQDPGYQWVPVHDPSAGHGLEVAQQTGFYYHDAGTDAPDVSSQSRYQKLRERILPPECKTSGVGNMPAAGPAILKHVAGKH